MVTWDDFAKIEIRSGTIIEAFDFPKAKKPAYRLTIDFGNSGIKHSSAQITFHYTNFFSQCLVLGVYDENNQVILLRPDKIVTNGQLIA